MNKEKNIMEKSTHLLIATISTGCITSCSSGRRIAQHRIVTNPMNLNHRFQSKDKSCQEAADPVLEYFKGYYYLFAPKFSGYWRSEGLADWEYIPCTTVPTLEDYAPTILPIGDTFYSTTSSEKIQIFKNAHPEKDTWEAVDTKLAHRLHDPTSYSDEDGKVYTYWGCSDGDPTVGVEVDPKDGFRALGEAKALITHHGDKYDWGVPGKNNEEPRQGWNEGSCMLKYEGCCYLQYTIPGTQYRIYGDGIYVGDTPLSPFGYVEDNPLSSRPGGFIGGAGHEHTSQDKYGNYWYVASMVISARHIFERQLGLLLVAVSSRSGVYAHTVWSDYLFYIPNRKADFDKTDLSMGRNLLSYRKPVQASSSLASYEPGNVNDKQIETQ